jgi:hypothetical protein
MSLIYKCCCYFLYFCVFFALLLIKLYKKIENVGVYVCSLISRERIHHFSQKMACLCLETRKRFQKGQNSESVLSSSPGEDSFCSSVTKQNRRMEPRIKLFVSVGRFQKQRLQTRTVLGSSPGKGVKFRNISFL